MLSRRAFLVSGASIAVVSGAGLTGAAWWPGSAQASEPWRMAGESLGDPRLDALAYAILAPNPHNRQPWQFRLTGDDRIDVYCDLDRLLPETDPFNRQITIGFGCMLELLRLAANAKGYGTAIDVFPDGSPQPLLDERRVATVRFSPGPQNVDPLFSEVLQRRSLKEPYDTARPVNADLLASMVQQAGSNLEVGYTVEAARVERLRDLTWHAWMIEYETGPTRRESIDLMRIGNRAIAENPDGIELGGLGMGLMGLTGIVSKDALDRPGSTAYKTGIDMFEPVLRSAQGHVWIVSPRNSRETQIEAGRTWVRLNLAAQASGLGIHPLSQSLQEFPQMAGPYQKIHDELKAGGGATVQMFGRVGYARFPAPTPRWPLQSRLIV